MKCVHYKGFQGAIEFEDDHLTVSVLHIDDMVSTTFDSASKAREVFEELVEDYIQTCAEMGKEVCRPHKGSFNVRISPEMHRRAAMLAADTDETLNSWVSRAIERQIAAETSLPNRSMDALHSLLEELSDHKRQRSSWAVSGGELAARSTSFEHGIATQMFRLQRKPSLHG